MFKCFDSMGKQVYSDDLAEVVQAVEGLVEGTEVHVMTVLGSEQVNVNPVKGLPCCVSPGCLKVTYSLQSELANLKTNDELMRILENVEEKFKTAKKTTKKHVIQQEMVDL